MGTILGDIVKAEPMTLADLSGRVLAIDAFNSLYAFLSIIRQPDGTPLMDRKGRVTSHLSGLLYRNVILLEHGIEPVYVFDGESPQLKRAEIERRKEVRETAHKKWEEALEEGRIEDAYKAAQASSRLKTNMIDESKELLQAMGVPVVQAPSEGEALAAQMAREGIVWASASQDNDSLLYNCPRMLRNLVGRRPSRGRSSRSIEPELIDLDENLRFLEISREQLIDIAILVGTDYNDKVPGVGPKTALKLIKEYGSLEKIESDKGMTLDFPYPEIRDIFLNPPEIELKKPESDEPNYDEVRRILCSEHDFSANRVDKALERLRESLTARDDTTQSSLSDFF
ncbi:MAG: flap endonuclease-1 [Candidatus Thorarchaeota archaeon]|nr:MAG: flap endonuclease-1 [Candidatus Thorarchaeota archaeon]